MKTRSKNYVINTILPIFVFGAATGVLTAVAVTLFKFCAKHIISLSELGYEYIRGHLYLLPIAVILLFAVALILNLVYKKWPEIRGGGIPASIGILRGIVSFNWLRTLLGSFLSSLVTFLVGAPLGTEGPSVKMGTAIGRMTVAPFGKGARAHDRYVMTGGACAGFGAATGAPVSGILFAIEEAHQRISPRIILISSVSVMFCHITSELLAPLLGVSVGLFPGLSIVSLELFDVWLPLVIGLVIGLFSVLFLRYYRVVNRFIGKALSRVGSVYKIYAVLLVTLILGLFSYSFVSTGHELILDVLKGDVLVYMLALILIARMTLTLSANAVGITGGIFLPMLSIGTLVSALLGNGLIGAFGLSEEYYATILALGITACISGMMKMPLTAIVFAVEALSCYDNIFYVIAVSAIAYVVTEMLDSTSINDSVLERTVEEQNRGKHPEVIDTFIEVKRGSFAIGKQVRDIFWPANLFVLSITKGDAIDAEVDEHGGKALRQGDVLHVRYMTFDEAATKEELFAIVGEQEFDESVTDVV